MCPESCAIWVQFSRGIPGSMPGQTLASPRSQGFKPLICSGQGRHECRKKPSYTESESNVEFSARECSNGRRSQQLPPPCLENKFRSLSHVTWNWKILDLETVLCHVQRKSLAHIWLMLLDSSLLCSLFCNCCNRKPTFSPLLLTWLPVCSHMHVQKDR